MTAEQSDRVHWWDRWNRALYPYFGPADLGSRSEAPQESSVGKPCPICGHSMLDHTVERAGDWTTASRLHCPVSAA